MISCRSVLGISPAPAPCLAVSCYRFAVLRFLYGAKVTQGCLRLKTEGPYAPFLESGRSCALARCVTTFHLFRFAASKQAFGAANIGISVDVCTACSLEHNLTNRLLVLCGFGLRSDCTEMRVFFYLLKRCVPVGTRIRWPVHRQPPFER